MDTQPRSPLKSAELDALRDFAAMAARELSRSNGAGQLKSQDSSEWLDGIAGALPAMVWLTDTAGRCTLLNRFPWDPSEKTAGNAPCDWRNVIPPEEADGDSKDDLAFECKI